jgi:acetamidase/formamidase
MAYADRLSPEYMEKVIWRALVAMESQASQLAQVDTGHLRDSLTIATNKRSKVEGVRAMFDTPIDSPSEDMLGVMGTNLEYAAAQEFGREDMPNYPAHPYMRPALDIMRARRGQITGAELKLQLAYYNTKHPYKVKEFIVKAGK